MGGDRARCRPPPEVEWDDHRRWRGSRWRGSQPGPSWSRWKRRKGRTPRRAGRRGVTETAACGSGPGGRPGRPSRRHPPRPAPTGCFGLTCLVTWIVRRITLVRTRGLSATGGRLLAAGVEGDAGEAAQAEDRGGCCDAGLQVLHVDPPPGRISHGSLRKRCSSAFQVWVKRRQNLGAARRGTPEGGVTVARWRPSRRRAGASSSSRTRTRSPQPFAEALRRAGFEAADHPHRVGGTGAGGMRRSRIW